MIYDEKAEDFWTSSGVGTNAGVTVTKAAVAGKAYVVTGLGVSGDAAALVTVESPSGTVLWRQRAAGAFVQNRDFHPGCLKGAPGDAMLVKISASTTNCEANLTGLTI
jgi:hypothetical protein